MTSPHSLLDTSVARPRLRLVALLFSALLAASAHADGMPSDMGRLPKSGG